MFYISNLVDKEKCHHRFVCDNATSEVLVKDTFIPTEDEEFSALRPHCAVNPCLDNETMATSEEAKLVRSGTVCVLVLRYASFLRVTDVLAYTPS